MKSANAMPLPDKEVLYQSVRFQSDIAEQLENEAR